MGSAVPLNAQLTSPLNSLSPTGGEGRGEGVLLSTKLQKPPNPLHIRLLGTQGIVMKAQDLPDLIQQPRLGIRDESGPLRMVMPSARS